MPPKAILFDLDDTLIHAHVDVENAWLAVAQEFSSELGSLTPVEFSDVASSIARSFWSDADRHSHWRLRIQDARREVVRRTMTRLVAQGREVPSARISNRIADRFTSYREENMYLFADTHEVLDEFRRRGVLLTLITNGASEAQRAKIDRFELAPRFDRIQIEGEHGFGKPDERAYYHALSEYQIAPREAWIVGDNFEWEVIAPQRLGIHSIWVDRNGVGVPEGKKVQPDRVIKTLSELL